MNSESYMYLSSHNRNSKISAEGMNKNERESVNGLLSSQTYAITSNVLFRKRSVNEYLVKLWTRLLEPIKKKLASVLQSGTQERHNPQK